MNWNGMRRMANEKLLKELENGADKICYTFDGLNVFHLCTFTLYGLCMSMIRAEI